MPPVVAWVLKVTVQVTWLSAASTEESQVSPERPVEATRLREELVEIPSQLATTTAVELAFRVAAVATKAADTAPSGIVTELGTVSHGLLSESETVKPPDGAAALKVTVQVAVVPELRDEGLQASPVRLAVATRLSDWLTEAPSRVAVMTAVELVVKVEAVAVNVAEVAPGGMVTAAGRFSRELFLPSATLAPLPGAAAPSVTVQVPLAPELSDDGLQVRLERMAEAVSWTVWVTDPLLSEAVITAFEFALTVDAVAVKPAEIAPAGIETDAGTLSAG
ncbi:MAG: hypothetical protein KJZ84_06970 [Bryobacteraceae bacterium]|nr:hypothetical protein [Bryobacteraceae bacterium]